VGVESGEAVTVIRRSNAAVPGAVEPVVWWPGGGSVANSRWSVGAWARAVSWWPVGGGGAVSLWPAGGGRCRGGRLGVGGCRGAGWGLGGCRARA
jgi:hypothetical protein